MSIDKVGEITGDVEFNGRRINIIRRMGNILVSKASYIDIPRYFHSYDDEPSLIKYNEIGYPIKYYWHSYSLLHRLHAPAYVDTTSIDIETMTKQTIDYFIYGIRVDKNTHLFDMVSLLPNPESCDEAHELKRKVEKWLKA